ncbi:hypothetical protein LINPERPRIM_LOCUS19488 [Linum perenne]
MKWVLSFAVNLDSNGLSPHYIPKLNSYDIAGGCSILQETGYKFAYDDCHRDK